MARESLHTIVRHLHRLTAAPGTAGLTDGQLLERWVRYRDEAAFEVLAWRHQEAGPPPHRVHPFWHFLVFLEFLLDRGHTQAPLVQGEPMLDIWPDDRL